MTRQQVFGAFFFAALLFLLYEAYQMIEGFLTPLAWAALLAVVFFPVQRRLTASLRDRPGLAAAILTTLVIAVVIVPTIILSTLLVNQSVEAYAALERFIESGEATKWVDYVQNNLLGSLMRRLPSGTVTRYLSDLPSMALTASNAVSGYLMSQATGAVRNVLEFFINFFLTTIALFFFFRDGDRMVASLRELIPMEPAAKDAVLTRFYTTLSAVVQGTLITAVAQGTLAGVGYWICGVPFTVLLSVGTAFLSLLPAGSTILWLGVVVYLFIVEASKVWAIFLFIWGAVVVSTVDNIIRPLVIGGQAKIPTVVLFFGILGGLRVYGVLGVFLAPAMIGSLLALVQIYRERYPHVATPEARAPENIA